MPVLLAAAGPAPVVATYYESWLDPADGTGLRAVSPGVSLVMLAFVRPDLSYPGGLDLRGTGLQFAAGGQAVRDAVAALHARIPRPRVVASVGGSTYTRWVSLDPAALVRLVADLGLDGVDLDYEPADPRCTPTGCATDASWRSIVARVRAALPRPAWLSVTGWSVGAYGRGRWAGARPASPWTGSMLAVLADPGPRAIDAVTVMAYDAGPLFDPAQAMAAYRDAFAGTVLGGVSVAAGTPPVAGPDGIALYGWLSRPPPGRPNAAAIAAAAIP